ncbi:NUDIX domain-containing protein [Microbacterium aurantiacum]|uniref:NUDIX domain-containing protein n=1 Tax=Microbacterium aurantiacum TaxID=162393 RepID=UPI001F2ECA68|nr:NUDIX domain-containing protein [Microbacterium aurantiacum]
MPASDYVQGLRDRVGTDFLLLPAVTAVIRDGDRFLLARQRDTQRWSLVGGGIEPGEQPADAVRREVREELGVDATVEGIVGAYGGPPLEAAYPNGDRVGYVTIAYACSLSSDRFALERAELIETSWVELADLDALDRHEWIGQVLQDAARS